MFCWAARIIDAIESISQPPLSKKKCGGPDHPGRRGFVATSRSGRESLPRCRQPSDDIQLQHLGIDRRVAGARAILLLASPAAKPFVNLFVQPDARGFVWIGLVNEYQ